MKLRGMRLVYLAECGLSEAERQMLDKMPYESDRTGTGVKALSISPGSLSFSDSISPKLASSNADPNTTPQSTPNLVPVLFSDTHAFFRENQTSIFSLDAI